MTKKTLKQLSTATKNDASGVLVITLDRTNSWEQPYVVTVKRNDHFLESFHIKTEVEALYEFISQLRRHGFIS